MNLKKATLLALLGLSCEFIIRTTGTFYLGLFRILIVAQTAQVISLLARVAIMIFFVYFYRDCVQKRRGKLKTAAALGILGSCAALLTSMKGFILVFQKLFSPELVSGVMTVHTIDTFLPWVNSILILYFFIVFWEEANSKERFRLKKASLFGLIGSAIGALATTMVFVNYLFNYNVTLFRDLTGSLAPVALMILTLGALGVIYFFLVYYREQVE